MRLNDVFDKIFCINLDRRVDRWDECTALFRRFDVDCERFPGSVVHDPGGRLNGNAGCTLSHRRLLRLIADSRWRRVLVLEDDFQPFIRPPATVDHRLGFDVTPEAFGTAFAATVAELPADWDLFYLGGHYGSNPLARVSPRIIRVNTMLTTSSYGVTPAFARVMSDHLERAAAAAVATKGWDYPGPIDVVFSEVLPQHNCYICQPRLMVQRASFSDLTERHEDYLGCMMDRNHENRV